MSNADESNTMYGTTKAAVSEEKSPRKAFGPQQLLLSLVAVNLVVLVAVLSVLIYFAVSLQGGQLADHFVNNISPDQVNVIFDKVAQSEAVPRLLSNLPFVLGDAQINWPEVAVQFLDKQLPELLDEAAKSFVELQAFVENFRLSISNRETGLDYSLQEVELITSLVLGLARSASAALSSGQDAPTSIEDIYPAPHHVEGVLGSALSLMGLKPQVRADGNGYFYPAFEWFRAQAKPSNLLDLFTTCENTFMKLESGREVILFQHSFDTTQDAYATNYVSCEDSYFYDNLNFYVSVDPSCSETWNSNARKRTCSCTVRGSFATAISFWGPRETYVLEEISIIRNFCSNIVSALRQY
mmetsp:Transcript_9879/g.23592  ORF Transcript_9879/g.23592 Transcript_9879/m.23592 type:complete len:355 (+) Transcript_9879:161-1225(+)